MLEFFSKSIWNDPNLNENLFDLAICKLRWIAHFRVFSSLISMPFELLAYDYIPGKIDLV